MLLILLGFAYSARHQTLQTAMAAAPRMAGMACTVSDPPAISLADPGFGLARGASYTLEWAIYPFVAEEAAVAQPEAAAADEAAADGGDGGCTDYYCFVNAQRHDLGSAGIRINQTGFLGPASTLHGDGEFYNQTGYSTCWNDSASSCGVLCQREAHANTCWEHWSAETWLAYMRAQGGPGGFVHINNEDMIGDKPGGCGQLDLNSNRFVDSKQRPADYDEYQWTLVNQTRLANALR
eukprot:SAG11_NODE_7693_length_1109_cov_1.375248_1_plen_237_part_00